MNFKATPLFILNALAFLVACSIAYAQATAPAAAVLKLPALVSDHMVLQADKPDPIWGWAPSGNSIKVEFVDAEGKTLAQGDATAGTEGRWATSLASLPSGTAGQLKITSGAETRIIQDVLVGQTWLCGGQSNMSYIVESFNVPPEVFEAAKQQATAAQGSIRFFNVTKVGADTPQDDVQGQWLVAAANNVRGCSAVAWYFAVALHDKLSQPVGLIVSAVTSTPAEAWIPKADLDASSVGPVIEQRHEKNLPAFLEKVKKYESDNAAWLAANPTPELQAQNAKTRPHEAWDPYVPAQYYNGMIHGLEPYAVEGVIWFQADGNMGLPLEYGVLIKTLITAWRQHWKDELPFYYVEMNNMRDDPQTKPVQENNLSIIREQQQAALELPKTGVVCSIDLGLKEPHFPNKEPVGKRLAALALNDLYKQPMPANSPQYKSFKTEGNKIRLQFDYADGLRIREGTDLKGFAIRGATGDWVWATGQVDGQDILVWSDQVAAPTAVRYAWAMNPITSVQNGAGLPMRPFRTDVP